MVTARHAATTLLIEAAERFPDIQPTTAALRDVADSREQQLATAITRTVMQRWITLEYLLDVFLRQPCNKLEPAMRGVLLGGAAQLIFLNRLPSYAVVDETVNLARKLVRPKAAGLVNAVLRKIAGLVQHEVTGKPWEPSAERLPTDDGFIPLSEPLLPEPAKDMAFHLAVATSQRVEFVRALHKQFGEEDATAICQYATVNPPTVVTVEDGFEVGEYPCREHDEPNAVVFDGSYDELRAFLTGHAQRRVQDTASTRAAAVTADLKPQMIVDFCAGRGTKSRQLALLHPEATVMAGDIDEHRFEDLCEAAKQVANLQAVRPQDIEPGCADLLLLDVPCSNSGVLARRPEARYRLTPKSYQQLQQKQRQIVKDTIALIKPGGHLLYSTCSLTQSENESQVQWIAKSFDAAILNQELTLPAGRDTSYHDGAFHALLKLNQ